MYMTLAFLSYLTLTSAVVAEPLLEFRLISANEIQSEQPLPSAGVLRADQPYDVEVPKEEGGFEKVERRALVSTRVPTPEASLPNYHYRFAKDIAVVGRFPESVFIEGLEKVDGLYTRTEQQFEPVQGEKGLYRAEKPASKRELVKESKLLEEINQFRKENGLEPFVLSVPKVTPFSRGLLNSLRRSIPRIPEVGNMTYMSAQMLYAPSKELRFFRGDKEVSYVEGNRRHFLNPYATTVDLFIEVPEAKGEPAGDREPSEVLYLVLYRLE